MKILQHHREEKKFKEAKQFFAAVVKWKICHGITCRVNCIVWTRTI